MTRETLSVSYQIALKSLVHLIFWSIIGFILIGLSLIMLSNVPYSPEGFSFTQILGSLIQITGVIVILFGIIST
ncbi:MAG: hypothetical protein ACXAC7_20830, partial [Candidatus Hodarchaeales archaeon]